MCLFYNFFSVKVVGEVGGGSRIIYPDYTHGAVDHGPRAEFSFPTFSPLCKHAAL